ncbi:Pyridoxal kinase [Aphelenchoides bicaudatus]|nr:Pyridoxal kinase [Aphelenchoides bicaudatus]
MAEAALLRDHSGKRVLSIQSHVVSGYAGNKCAVFPLQLHGFEVDVINSVQFSNHTGHKNGIRGTKLTLTELQDLVKGLEANELLEYSHVLTGYCGDVGFLKGIVALIKKLKQKNPNLIYVCDPVLGDDGYYYTPEELMAVYRDEVLYIADVLTPNAFELSEITGLPCKTQEECLCAVNEVHKKYGIKHVVVTSGVESKQDTVLNCFASSNNKGQIKQFRFDIPRIRGHYVGTGDVFACLLLVWLNDTFNDIELSVKNVLMSLQALLKKTAEKAYGKVVDESKKPTFKERELCLISGRLDLLIPSGEIVCVHL